MSSDQQDASAVPQQTESLGSGPDFSRGLPPESSKDEVMLDLYTIHCIEMYRRNGWKKDILSEYYA